MWNQTKKRRVKQNADDREKMEEVKLQELHRMLTDNNVPDKMKEQIRERLATYKKLVERDGQQIPNNGRRTT